MASLATPSVSPPQLDQAQPSAVALPLQPSSDVRNAAPSITAWRSALIAWAAIASVPLTFIVATRGDWLLDFGGEDGWIYIKLFMVWGDPHADLRTFLDSNYKATRIPWIIPGWLLYQLAGPLVATYLLHTIVLLGSALAVWLAVRRLFGDGAAVITALFAIAYPGFQSSGITSFWNYHGQAAVGYYLLATLAVVLARDARYPILWFGLAGAALVATLSTAITHIVLLPAFAVLTLALLPQLAVRSLLTALAGGMVGVAAGVIAFGLVNWLAGGPFLFFWAQVAATHEYLGAAPQQPFLRAFPMWVQTVRWAGFPPLVAAISLFALAPLAHLPALGSRRRMVIGCLVQHLVAWVVLLLLEDRSQLIQVAFHYHLMMGSAIFALAALIWVGLRLDRRALSIVAVAILAVGLVAPQLLLDEGARDAIGAALDLGRWLPLPSSDWWAYGLALTAGLALLLLGVARRLLPLVAMGSAVLGVSCALNAVSAEAYRPPERCSYVTYQYRLILKTVEWSVTRQLDTKALIWFDPAATLPRANDCPAISMFPIFDAIQHGTIIRLAAQPIPPRLDEASTAQLNGAIRSRERMVLLSTPAGAADAEEQFQTWLRRASVRGVAERGERFELADGDVSVVVQVFDLRRR